MVETSYFGRDLTTDTIDSDSNSRRRSILLGLRHDPGTGKRTDQTATSRTSKGDVTLEDWGYAICSIDQDWQYWYSERKQVDTI